MKTTQKEIAQVIEDFLSGKGGRWDWDDFTSIRINDTPELDAIRIRCATLPDSHPPDRPGCYCNDEGIRVLESILNDLRSVP
jgi:hypothetical protein